MKRRSKKIFVILSVRQSIYLSIGKDTIRDVKGNLHLGAAKVLMAADQNSRLERSSWAQKKYEKRQV